ncbi:MAG: protein mraZ [Bacteroidales bacterium]|nr:protein mraZ [Bacteroidales bacterium]
MGKFIGEYKAKVDDKGRLIFPSAFKSLMEEGSKLCFVVKKDLFTDCLEMFAFSEWERESEAVKARLNFFNKEHSMFWREYMRDRAIVEPDEKLGRILIPKRLLENIGVNKEVVFSGNDHKIEIWAREKFEKQKLGNEDFVSLAQKILG